jgi:predicted ArsR family transcriptional regulator
MRDSPPEELSTELKAFLYSCIDSVEQLETLVLVGESGRAWTARGIGERLGISDTAARDHLESLAARGLLQISVAAEVSYGYGPKTADLQRYADRLLERYRESRTAVLRFVASSPRRLKRFADAFKLRDSE